jgi:hypothetical protein
MPPVTGAMLEQRVGTANCTALDDSFLHFFNDADQGIDCEPTDAGLPDDIMFLKYSDPVARQQAFAQGVANLPGQSPCAGAGVDAAALPSSLVCSPASQDGRSRAYWLDNDQTTYVRISDNRHSLLALLQWLSSDLVNAVSR